MVDFNNRCVPVHVQKLVVGGLNSQESSPFGSVCVCVRADVFVEGNPFWILL